MTTLSHPTHIDMTHLLMRQHQEEASAHPSPSLTEDIETSLSGLSEAITHSIGTYKYVVVSNKGMHGNSSYFILWVHPKTLRLAEQNGFQKSTYLFSMEEGTLKLNDRDVEDSFIYSFLGKLDVISNAILSHKAKILGKSDELT